MALGSLIPQFDMYADCLYALSVLTYTFYSCYFLIIFMICFNDSNLITNIYNRFLYIVIFIKKYLRRLSTSIRGTQSLLCMIREPSQVHSICSPVIRYFGDIYNRYITHSDRYILGCSYPECIISLNVSSVFQDNWVV